MQAHPMRDSLSYGECFFFLILQKYQYTTTVTVFLYLL